LLPTAILITTTPAAPTPVINCGESGTMNVFVLVRSIVKEEPAYGVDSIRFYRVDFSQKRLSIIALPRDLWVSTPVLANWNINNSRLGLVFNTVEQGTAGSTADKYLAATKAVIQTIKDNFDVVPDHYFFIDPEYFAKAIDQLGGLDINIPADFSVSGFKFLAGQQHIDGQTALLYVSGNRDSEWARLDRQNLVLKTLLAKVAQPANITKIPALLDQFKSDFVTDLTPAQILNLSCMVDKIQLDQITTTQVGSDMITGTGPNGSMLPNVDKIKQFLADQLKH
jgi:LCP family protein required for cell wall assembly